jgi:outer membrane lipoprotein-sorting protein
MPLQSLPRLPLAERRSTRRRALLALAAAGLACALPLRAQGTFDLAQLMQTLAQVKAGEARFTETRTVTMTDMQRTLQSSGRLSFQAPDTFVRETLKPRAEKVAVVGNTVTMSLGTRSRTVPLDSVPEAAVIMEAIRGTLTGNRAAIERHFVPSVSGTAQRWTLELKPLEPRLRELVVAVRLGGERALVREVTVAMADGDKSVMTIEPITAVPATAPAPGTSPSTSAAPKQPASAPN